MIKLFEQSICKIYNKSCVNFDVDCCALQYNIRNLINPRLGYVFPDISC